MSRRFSFLVALLCAAVLPSAMAGSTSMQPGTALLSMCKGADKVRTLSVMCHSYLNGYLDAAAFHGRDGAYCLTAEDKARLPQSLVDWFASHPAHLKEPAGKVLHEMLVTEFACRRK